MKGDGYFALSGLSLVYFYTTGLRPALAGNALSGLRKTLCFLALKGCDLLAMGIAHCLLPIAMCILTLLIIRPFKASQTHLNGTKKQEKLFHLCLVLNKLTKKRSTTWKREAYKNR